MDTKTKMSFRRKITLAIVFIVLLLGLTITFVATSILSESLRKETKQKGVSLTRSLASLSTNLILTENLLGLKELVDEQKALEEGIVYIFVTNSEDRVLVHTFSGGFPVELKGANPLPEGEKSNVRLLETNEGFVYDVTVPILVNNERIGLVRIGISEMGIRRTINKTSGIMVAIIFLAIIISIFIGLWFSGLVTKPVKELHEATLRMMKGDLDVRVEIKTGDEIQSLGEAFNLMAAELKDYHANLTEKVRSATENLSRANKELEEERKELAAVNLELDSFTYSASHDLKEPLRSIETFSKFLLEDYAERLDETGKDYLQRVGRAAMRMKSLIEDLLSLSKLSRIKNPYTSVDSLELIKDALSRLKPLLSERKVRIEIPEVLPSIFCDEIKMKEVFYNLISNAIKYSDKPEPMIWVKAEDEGGEVVFSIADNGIGIKREYFDLIFQAFKRLHGQDEYGGGTGIGLAMVKKIIEEGKGRIWVSSEEGKGTIFFFTTAKGSE